jgi:hypothetical protein
MVSGLVWLLTGMVWLASGPGAAFIFLFFGGMAIAPLAEILSRRLFKAPRATHGKKLEMIGLITVPIILAGFYFGWKWYGIGSASAIALVAVAVGLRYLTFPAMFGGVWFWALGGCFVALGLAALRLEALPLVNLAIVLGLIELAVGYILYRQWLGIAPPA